MSEDAGAVGLFAHHPARTPAAEAAAILRQRADALAARGDLGGAAEAAERARRPGRHSQAALDAQARAANAQRAVHDADR